MPDIRRMRMRRESILALVGAGEGISLQPETALTAADLDIAIRDIHDPAGPPYLDYVACWRRTNTSPVLANFLSLLNTSSSSPLVEVNSVENAIRGEGSSTSSNEEPF